MTVTTYSWMSAQTGATNAEWRKWVQGIHDALAACGMTQTSDTGQVTISSATVPAINTWTLYEIWRFSDSLQSTKPVFLRIDYGVGSTAGRANIRLTIGTSTDGAGTIGGSSLLPATVLSTTSPSASSTEYPSYASGDGSSFSLALWATTSISNHIGGFAISRSCDTSGTYTGDAITIALFGANYAFNVIGTTGTDGSVESAKGAFAPAFLPNVINGVTASASSTLSEDGTTAPVFPLACAAPGVEPFVLNSMVAVHPGDAGASSVIQVATINGSSRTYRAFVAAPSTNGPGNIGVSNATAPPRCLPAIAWAV